MPNCNFYSFRDFRNNQRYLQWLYCVLLGTTSSVNWNWPLLSCELDHFILLMNEERRTPITLNLPLLIMVNISQNNENILVMLLCIPYTVAALGGLALQLIELGIIQFLCLSRAFQWLSRDCLVLPRLRLLTCLLPFQIELLLPPSTNPRSFTYRIPCLPGCVPFYGAQSRNKTNHLPLLSDITLNFHHSEYIVILFPASLSLSCCCCCC